MCTAHRLPTAVADGFRTAPLSRKPRTVRTRPLPQLDTFLNSLLWARISEASTASRLSTFIGLYAS
jgi:hypothetical protein